MRLLRNVHSFALLALLVVGCGGDVTQVVVSIDAESSWMTGTTNLHVVVRGAPSGDAGFEPAARDVTLAVGQAESNHFPVRIVVAPKSGQTSRRWSVEATATNGANVATVRVRGSYVADHALHVDLLIENSCANITCPADQTCRAGACVDAGLAASVDAGMDSGTSMVKDHCASASVYTPNSNAGTLDDDAGVAPTYLTLDSCPTNHPRDALCTLTATADDICYSARNAGGMALCRIPCSRTEVDGGMRDDDPRCAAYHPSSRCALETGDNAEYDKWLCSIPCNPFDDVGCPQGLHCYAIWDSADLRFETDCLEASPEMHHQNEPCTIVNGGSYPSVTGCAPGYTCNWDVLCETSAEQGYTCSQVCDSSASPGRLACPSGTHCLESTAVAGGDQFGPVRLGTCRAD